MRVKETANVRFSGLLCMHNMNAGGEKYGARGMRRTVYLDEVLFCFSFGFRSNCCFDTVQQRCILNLLLILMMQILLFYL